MLRAGFVVRAAQGVLDVAEDGVQPSEVLQLHAGRPTAGDHRLVLDARRGDAAEAAEAIADDDAVGVDEFLRPSGQLALAETGDDAQAQLHRMALGILRECGHERGLLRRAATRRLAMALPAPVVVVDLDHAGQLALAIALQHGLQELVLDAPGGRVGDAEPAHELQRGDGVFLLLSRYMAKNQVVSGSLL